jgi:serine protease Do
MEIMERRTRDWLKFGALVAVGLVLAGAFASVVDFPESSEAQQAVPARTAALTALQPPPVEPNPTVDALGEAFSSVAEAVRPSVVFINAETRARARNERPRQLPEPFDRFFRTPDDLDQQPRRGQGSGFIISPDGYIITNNHVVEGFDRLEVTLFDRRRFTATVVGRDPNTDVALIKIDAPSLRAVTFGNSDSLRVGEWVLAIGNPLGVQFPFTVTAGIVSGRGRALGNLLEGDYNIQDFIQTDAAINPGNSGGPLVNIRGQVVGVNSAIASRTGYYSGYSFAIPINLARTVTQQLIEKGHVTRAVLGVAIRPVEPEDAEYVGLEEIRGVVVQDYSTEDSPARRSGIRPGDVIIEVDGKRVDYVAELQQLVGFKQPGEQVRVTVARQGGERRTFAVRLAEAPITNDMVASRGEDNEGGERALHEAALGIEVEPLNRDLLARYGAPRTVTGVVITRVDPDGPSRDKLPPSNPSNGFLASITQVNGQPVSTVQDLDRLLRTVRPGEIVSLRVAYANWDGSGSSRVTEGVVRVRVGESQ